MPVFNLSLKQFITQPLKWECCHPLPVVYRPASADDSRQTEEACAAALCAEDQRDQQATPFHGRRKRCGIAGQKEQRSPHETVLTTLGDLR